jgi:hypothetical protein
MIAAAALTGDRRATLEAMRDKLATDMDEAPPAVVAQIAGRLSAILVELDELGAAKKVSTLDELETKRADRLAAAGVPDAARRQTRQRRTGSD